MKGLFWGPRGSNDQLDCPECSGIHSSCLKSCLLVRQHDLDQGLPNTSAPGPNGRSIVRAIGEYE